MRQKGYSIVGIYGLYTGWWFLKKDAIKEHTEKLGKDWKSCLKKGDRVVKITISWDSDSLKEKKE